MHVPGESRGEKAMKHDDRVRMFLRKLTGPICLVRFWGSDAIVESVEGVEQWAQYRFDFFCYYWG
jgi:hypothetical protein